MTEETALMTDKVKREAAKHEGEKLALSRLADEDCIRCQGGGIVGFNQAMNISIPCMCTRLTPQVWLKVWTKARRAANKKAESQIVGPDGAPVSSQLETSENA